MILNEIVTVVCFSRFFFFFFFPKKNYDRLEMILFRIDIHLHIQFSSTDFPQTTILTAERKEVVIFKKVRFTIYVHNILVINGQSNQSNLEIRVADKPTYWHIHFFTWKFSKSSVLMKSLLIESFAFNISFPEKSVSECELSYGS